MSAYEQVIVEQLAGRGKRKISEVIYAGLRAVILDGRLALDERINEQHLAAALSVSRTPLRQALDWLVAEQLLAYEENRGVRVINVTEDTIREIYTLQLRLEPLLYQEVMRRVTPAQLADLAASFSQIKVYEASGQVDQLRQLISRFKAVMISQARTPILEHLLQELERYVGRLNGLLGSGVGSGVGNGVGSRSGEVLGDGHVEQGGKVPIDAQARQLQLTLRAQWLILNCLIDQDMARLEVTLKQHIRQLCQHSLRHYRLAVGGLDRASRLGDHRRTVADGQPFYESIACKAAKASTVDSRAEASRTTSKKTSIVTFKDSPIVSHSSPQPEFSLFICKEVNCPLYTSFQKILKAPTITN